ncbi:alpha/beta hydrolase [Desulfosarcina cetonica]|uniref:YheT family hydrolase n=1 Tax=Desulfosarcina cetonica TaxID=90730 RepID=UPI0006CF6C15|nr:alpha/beta fold hydrolase [Desulfosarcina cetonica]
MDSAIPEAVPFVPPLFLKPAMLQTFLASASLRAWGNNPMLDAARKVVLTTDQGVRLLGFISRQPRPHNRGMVILLHGWEGSANSTYVLTTGRFLFNRGYDVFRLNFRDHGPSHHLNPGIFYAVLLDEVFDAVRQVAAKEHGRPVFLAGFSLGGNFALRIARKCAQRPIFGLKHVFAVSPVIDPDKATDRIDGNRFILGYFLKKWRRSLGIKQRCFPARYDFSHLMKVDTIREMTERLLVRYSAYDSAKAYFRDYSLRGDGLHEIRLPTTIVTAADDPIIPIEDFCRLAVSDTTRLLVQPHGGHNGFLGWQLTGWYEPVMDATFKNGSGTTMT